MADQFELLSLSAPAGNGQENDPEDTYALDGALRGTDSYDPPPGYADEPQRYATASMIGALEPSRRRTASKSTDTQILAARPSAQSTIAYSTSPVVWACSTSLYRRFARS